MRIARFPPCPARPGSAAALAGDGAVYCDAISNVFPATQIQLCIVHMVRNSMKYVSWKDYKAVSADLRRIYQSATEDEALLALDQFAERWDEKYPHISRTWRHHWQNLNSVIRKAIKKRKLFPSDDSARKVVYLAIMDASKKWTMPIRNWKGALNRFIIEFEDRLIEHV